jgi:hypothetical protein
MLTAHSCAQNTNESGTRQARFYDFNVWTTKKRIEKLRYLHRNPGSPASPLLACWGESR